MSDKGNPQVRVRSSKEFRLKDNPPQRRVQFVNLKQVFGFIPEIIAVEKVTGKNNRLAVHAILTPEEIEKQEKLMAEMKEIQEAERENAEKNLKKEAKAKIQEEKDAKKPSSSENKSNG